MTFTDWPWRHWRQVRSQAPALRLNDEVLSWRALCERIDVLAGGFAAQGVREGDGVLLRAGNQPRTLLAWLALMQCGARVSARQPAVAPDIAGGAGAEVNAAFCADTGRRKCVFWINRVADTKEYSGVCCGLATAASGFHDADIGFHRIAKSGCTYVPGASCQRAGGAFANAVWPSG